MIVTATEFKTNLGKYLDMAASQDIFITRTEKALPASQAPLSTSWRFWTILWESFRKIGQWTKIPYGRSGCPDNENTD